MLLSTVGVLGVLRGTESLGTVIGFAVFMGLFVSLLLPTFAHVLVTRFSRDEEMMRIDSLIFLPFLLHQAGGFASCWFAASTDIAGPSPLPPSPSPASTNRSHRIVGKGNHELAGTIFGTIGIIRGIAAIVGPILSGSLITYSHSSPDGGQAGEGGWEVMGKFGYGKFVMFLGVVSAGTAALILGIPVVDRWRKERRSR